METWELVGGIISLVVLGVAGTALVAGFLLLLFHE